MRDPVSVLICGAGSRGSSVYGRFIKENPQLARVVAVADPVKERRIALANQHGIPDSAVFASWQEIPSSSPLAQVAVVATDDRDHVDPALFFLDNGYHLLLEKPMAPDLEGCRIIVEAAERSGRLNAVCHVLRYTPYFQKLKSLIDQGLVGQVATIRHLEGVNYWHFAHSFVRGNWRNSETSSPFLLAKCCHDMDILLFLMGEEPESVQSFGSLFHFCTAGAPPEAAGRCLDCSIQSTCTYSATRFYGDALAEGRHGWPLDVITRDFTPDGVETALRNGPYGRCVYRCDNDAPDHQIVNLRFKNGATASLTATAFTELPARHTEVMGTRGSLTGDGERIVYRDFQNRAEQTFEVHSEGHHLGGDEAMLEEYFTAVSQDDPSGISTSPTVSLLSHRMALTAERSRKEGRILSLQSLCTESPQTLQ